MHRNASFLVLALLAACSSAPPSTSPSTPSPGELTLAIGEAARLGDGSQLRYLQLVDDSRCPPDVQCIWAGDAEIALRWQPATGRAEDLRLHTNAARGGATSAMAGPHRIHLAVLERGIAPKATLRIDTAD